MTSRLFAALFSALLAMPTSAHATESLTITTGFTAPISTLYQKILEQACKRIGVRLDFHEMPAERSMMLVNNGIHDGECCRIPAIMQQDYPGLLAVPESVFRVAFSAFTKNPLVKLTSWEDLKPYSVGTVAGWKIVVQNVARVKPASYVVVDGIDPLFRMLDLGRIDVAVIGEPSGLDTIRRMGVQGVRLIEPPLATIPVQLMLNSRHADWVPKFDAAFKAMKADGTMDAIIKDVIR